MAIIKDMLSGQYEVQSRGIINYFQNSMDARSINYLEKQGIEKFIHIPQCISKKDVKEFDLILLMDFDVYDYFSRNFKNFLHKTYLFNSINNNYDTSDPVRFDDQSYFEVMENIKSLSLEWSEKIKNTVNQH